MPVFNGLETTGRPQARELIPTGPAPVVNGLETMQPIYTSHNTQAAYQLNWGLTLFWRSTSIGDEGWLQTLQERTEPDGVRVLKHEFTTNNASQLFVSTKPHVAPFELIRSVKGRLQNLIRQRAPKAFRRNYPPCPSSRRTPEAINLSSSLGSVMALISFFDLPASSARWRSSSTEVTSR